MLHVVHALSACVQGIIEVAQCKTFFSNSDMSLTYSSWFCRQEGGLENHRWDGTPQSSTKE